MMAKNWCDGEREPAETKVAEWANLFRRLSVARPPTWRRTLVYAGLDFHLLDHKHGQGSLDDAIGQLRAMKDTDCTGVLRVPANDHIYIKRALIPASAASTQPCDMMRSFQIAPSHGA